MQSNDLSGVSVLVTRPVDQAEHLAKLVEQHAGTAVLLPLIEIEPVDETAATDALSSLVDYDVVIFISVNAVRHAAAFITKNRQTLPVTGAIGRGTARQLEDLAIKPGLMPEQSFNTEGFLALDDVQEMTGKRVLIVRGKGGREKLANTLQARGAEVDYAEVYRRVMPDLQMSNKLGHSDIDVITLTSGDALNNLATLANRLKQNWIFEKPLIVIHDRIAQRAKQAGFKIPALVTSEVSDEAIIDQLVQWKKSQGAGVK